jgi:hypothetical protein
LLVDSAQVVDRLVERAISTGKLSKVNPQATEMRFGSTRSEAVACKVVTVGELGLKGYPLTPTVVQTIDWQFARLTLAEVLHYIIDEWEPNYDFISFVLTDGTVGSFRDSQADHWLSLDTTGAENTMSWELHDKFLVLDA